MFQVFQQALQLKIAFFLPFILRCAAEAARLRRNLKEGEAEQVVGIADAWEDDNRHHAYSEEAIQPARRVAPVASSFQTRESRECDQTDRYPEEV